MFASGGSRRGICGGGSGSGNGGFFATIFLDAKGEKKIGSFGDWI